MKSETKLGSIDDGPSIFPSLVKFGPRTPENSPEKVPPLKFNGENVLNSLLLSCGFLDFAQILYKVYTGQRVKGPGHSVLDTTYQHQ